MEKESCGDSRINETSKLETGLMDSKGPRVHYTLEELKKKVDHLIELNLERCRIMQGKGELTTWVDEKKGQEV